MRVDDLPDDSVGKKFAEKFGREEADRILLVGLTHRREHFFRTDAKLGSDPFKGALAFVIGMECVTKYAKEHGFKLDPAEFKAWVIEHGEMRSHDGDFDGLALLAGSYNEWLAAE